MNHCNYSTLLLKWRSSYRTWVNEWVWLLDGILLSNTEIWTVYNHEIFVGFLNYYYFLPWTLKSVKKKKKEIKPQSIRIKRDGGLDLVHKGAVCWLPVESDGVRTDVNLDLLPQPMFFLLHHVSLLHNWVEILLRDLKSGEFYCCSYFWN